MKFQPWLKVSGDTKFRGACPSEGAEQVTFVNRIREKYPNSYGRILLHPRNEGKRTLDQARREKADGLATGAADIIIPGRITFVCELKRRDHTKSSISDEQINYLRVCDALGAFVCVALGCDAAEKAFNEWVKIYES